MKVIIKLISLSLLSLMFSCNPVDKALSNIVDQVEGQVNGGESFSRTDLQGIWQTEQDYYHYDLPQVFEEARNLPLERFNKISDKSEKIMKDQFLGNCSALSSKEQVVDEIASKFYLIIKNNSYQYIALSNVEQANGQSEKCWVEISQGNYDILGNYLHLKNLNVAFSVNMIDYARADIGFASN